MLCGGLSQSHPADEEIQKLCDKIKPDLEAKANRKFNVFEAKEYSSQVVAGTNYFVKIHVGDESYVHVRVFKPLPHEGPDPSLHAHQLDKTKEDAIGYF